MGLAHQLSWLNEVGGCWESALISLFPVPNLELGAGVQSRARSICLWLPGFSQASLGDVIINSSLPRASSLSAWIGENELQGDRMIHLFF